MGEQTGESGIYGTLKMYIIHEATIKQMNGIIEISVIIINKVARTYTYALPSQFAVDQFEYLYRKGRKLHGRALAILNKFKLKEK